MRSLSSLALGALGALVLLGGCGGSAAVDASAVEHDAGSDASPVEDPCSSLDEEGPCCAQEGCSWLYYPQSETRPAPYCIRSSLICEVDGAPICDGGNCCSDEGCVEPQCPDGTSCFVTGATQMSLDDCPETGGELKMSSRGACLPP